jgi:hypothetical protein
MPIQMNGQNIGAVYYGRTPIREVWMGRDLVWRKFLARTVTITLTADRYFFVQGSEVGDVDLVSGWELNGNVACVIFVAEVTASENTRLPGKNNERVPAGKPIPAGDLIVPGDGLTVDQIVFSEYRKDSGGEVDVLILTANGILNFAGSAGGFNDPGDHEFVKDWYSGGNGLRTAVPLVCDRDLVTEVYNPAPTMTTIPAGQTIAEQTMIWAPKADPAGTEFKLTPA